MRRTATSTATTAATTTAIASLSAVLLPLVLAGPAAAVPSCVAPVPLVACGGRVVAEPELSVAFHQFEGPVESLGASLEAIEARSPDFLEVGPISEFTGDPAHESAGGRDLWVVRITDEKDGIPREQKKQVAASLSVHGLEAAGREGGLRYVEDLAIWTAALKGGTDRVLGVGSAARKLSEVMHGTESWFAFTNPDGWAAGDLANAPGGPGFVRGNETGADLNRDYATKGWYTRDGGRGVAESEPETRGWTALVEAMPNLTTSTDVHGELTTPNQAFSDLIIPAGQWTPQRQLQVKTLGDHMISTIEKKFDEEGVVLDDVFGPLPDLDGSTPRKPANVAASYDIVGYDDSGFMGDWFSQTQDSVHMDVENFLSNLAPNNGYDGLVEQAHVAAVRGILEATVVEALSTGSVAPVLQARAFAYVQDSTVTTDADGRGPGAQVAAGETPVPYSVNRLRYLEEVERATGRPAQPFTAQQVAAGELTPDAYPSLVVADTELPPGAGVSKEAFAAGLAAYAQQGGQVVLTDRAVGLVDDVTGTPALQRTVDRTDAGHVDFLAPLGDHPYEKGLVGKPSQTYYEVMLGFPSRSSAPNFGVARSAWEAAGGTTVATVGAQGASTSPNTALGSMPLGKGRVTIFGALLPQAVEELVREDGTRTSTPHPFGLADYAVTITGGQVLDNVLAYAPDAVPASTTTTATSAPSLLSRSARALAALRPAALWRRATRGAGL
ncbi:MAG: hypothetical protein JWO60_3148 [Frankiales bacterium]|nr:hypothetical protein [Frankiales bacterium]